MKRGLSNNKRIHARNFIQEEAQKRLQEVLPEFDAQTHNALYVNKTDMDFYSKNSTGVPCTCNSIPMVPEYSNIADANVPPVIPVLEESEEVTVGGGVEIGLRSEPLFGETEPERNTSDSIINILGEGLDIEPQEVDSALHDSEFEELEYVNNAIYGNNVDCGICYRAGFTPAYTMISKHRIVKTSHDIVDVDGYFINTTHAPVKIELQADSGYVEFLVRIPKYFRSSSFSIRNNLQVLAGSLLYYTVGPSSSLVPISLQFLKANAGREVSVKVTAEVFTHFTIDFKLNDTEHHCNISEDSTTLDYMKLETLSNFQVVVPNTIHSVSSGDIIVCSSRKLTLKVNDVQKKRTAEGKVFGWELATRVLQPSESLNNMNLSQIIR